MDELIARLSEAFTRPLPGWEAQSRMINYQRPKVQDVRKIDPGARNSAVLALLYPKNNEIYTVLMLRNDYKGTHSGQVSFPGGKREDWDGSLWETALREAREEVSVQPSEVQKIGELTPVYITHPRLHSSKSLFG
ncbi:MAG: CoA pyrophosphatase [Flavobacteriales bacterium]|nr:CoA pyrophosphatase [Flavobacteriales bacterium]